MQIDRFVEDKRRDRPARHDVMTIIAQDPSVLGDNQRILRARVPVPASRLEPGPRGARFHVVDYDPGLETLPPPAVLFEPDNEGAWSGSFVDRFEHASDDELLADRDFHAQNCYAIAARTLALFEKALGRRLGWSFGDHQLFLIPHRPDRSQRLLLPRRPRRPVRLRPDDDNQPWCAVVLVA